MIPTATLSAFIDNHIEVSNTLRELQLAGIDTSIISVIGKDSHTDGQSTGFYQTGHGPHYKGSMGAFWTGLWTLLPGSAFFVIPDVGQVLLAGPIVNYLVNGYDGLNADQPHHALHAALIQNHIPSSHVAQYEAAIRSGRFVLLIHGTASEVAIARIILQRQGSDLSSTHVHQVVTPSMTAPSTMRRHYVKVTSLSLIMLTVLAATGCGDSSSDTSTPDTKGPAQRAGEATDKAVQKTGEAVQKAGEKIQDSTK